MIFLLFIRQIFPIILLADFLDISRSVFRRRVIAPHGSVQLRPWPLPTPIVKGGRGRPDVAPEEAPFRHRTGWPQLLALDEAEIRGMDIAEQNCKLM